VNFVLLLLAAFVVAPTTVFWLAGPALAWALIFNVGYAYSLQDRGRPDRRIEGDRWVARYVAFGLLLPFLAAVALWLFGYNRDVWIGDFTVTETASFFVGAAALFVLVICSSIIDWYYIRPRIDGVVCTPPCRSSGSDTWKGTTRWWYLHRGLATIAYMAFALVVALVVMLMLVREHPAAAGVIGGVGGLAGLLLIFAGNYRSQLPSVAQFVLSPAYCLGDDLSYEAGKWSGRGFVLHVAVPVTKLVPLNDYGHPTTAPFVERKNSDLNEADLTSQPTIACKSTCMRLNPQCAAGVPRHDRRRRHLIL
jgi:hypothetical protein